jgi:hypothetical protein
MNDTPETAPPAAPRPVRWDEAIVATYLYELAKGAA